MAAPGVLSETVTVCGPAYVPGGMLKVGAAVCAEGGRLDTLTSRIRGAQASAMYRFPAPSAVTPPGEQNPPLVAGPPSPPSEVHTAPSPATVEIIPLAA